MKKTVRLGMMAIFTMMFVVSAMAQSKPVKEPEIQVILNNIKSNKGVFVISFYNVDKAFPKPGKELFTQRVTVSDTATHRIKIRLPFKGWYAIAMFQDEEGTGKIKQDKIGIPLEPYGFSNNIHPKIEAPSFSACKFYAEANDDENVETTITISLIQPRFGQKK